MKIGIIGAGNVGSALAKATVRAGHDVKISSRDASDAQRLASEASAQAVSSNREAVADAEIVIPAVMFNDIGSIVDELGSALDGKVLIDVSNRFMPDQLGQPSNAEQVQEMAPGARVVKAFNTVFASLQGSPQTNGVQLDGLVAGDDAEAKAKVVELVRSLGFRPIDAGPLPMARALEGMGTLNIQLNHTNGWPWQTGWKLVGPTGQS
jgi:8-hydroxy-5-deazaflavin:NADPH oxidoreductase